jgi:Tfp pilus assembly protein PilF
MNKPIIFTVALTLALANSCSESRDGVSVNAAPEVDCRNVDQKAADLIVKPSAHREAAKLLDKAIEKCAPDARRHHQRAMVAAALGDAKSETSNMDRAIAVAEKTGDKCLLDLMILEKKGLQLRKSIFEFPASCNEKRISKR